jgi:undecaprenyl-diphosphatase
MPDIPALFLVAIVQGITEFLPVSSSGHLVLLPQLTHFEDQGQTIDVAAHIGTLAAVMVYVRRDIFNMLASLTRPVSGVAPHRRLIALLAVASLPVVIAGFLLEMAGPEFLRAAIIVAIANLIFAVWLWQADKCKVSCDLTAHDNAQPDWQKMPFKHAFYIGLAQIFALIPGASRSGVTMTMARQLGYDRLSAARFSLLLSLPVIAGAGLLKSLSIYKGDISVDMAAIIIVAGLSFIFALLAIRWMMGWLAHANFRIFVIYRILLSILLIGLIATGSL